MTNSELIRDALGLLGVLNEVETPSAEQGVHALRNLNQIMEVLEEDGIKLQYFAQTDTSADFPAPVYSEMGITAALAIKLAPSYGATVSVELAAQYEMGMAIILRKAVKPPVASMGHLPQGEARHVKSDILNGD
jgi:hypothetical protein